jgi:hypothetical protein
MQVGNNQPPQPGQTPKSQRKPRTSKPQGALPTPAVENAVVQQSTSNKIGNLFSKEKLEAFSQKLESARNSFKGIPNFVRKTVELAKNNKGPAAAIAGVTAAVFLAAAGIKKAVDNRKDQKALAELQVGLLQAEAEIQQTVNTIIMANKENIEAKDDIIEALKGKLAAASQKV